MRGTETLFRQRLDERGASQRQIEREPLMRSVSTLLACSLPLLAAGVSSMATPISAVDVPAIEQMADTIVVGRVAADRPPGAGEELRTVEIAVDRVVKSGGLPLGLLMQVRLPAGEPVRSNLQVGSYGLFFADCSTSQPCAAVSAHHPSLVALAQPGLLYALNGSTTDKIVAELVSVLLADDPVLIASGGFGDGAGAAAQAWGSRARSIEALATVAKSSAGPVLQAAITSAPSMHSRMAITAALVRLGEFSSLAGVESQMLSSQAPFHAARRLLAQSMFSVQSPPVTSVALLTPWLRAQDVEVRRAAAYVLSDVGSREAVAPLRDLALADADQMVRYYAVSGLASVTGRGHIPSLQTYRAAESRYLTDWKNWGKSTAPK
jgi:HEAT repeats